MVDKINKFYFPNLDGLRFLGSMVIIVLHIENIKIFSGRETIGLISHFHPLGNLAVSFFFVLSGFLITYLLLKEKENTSTINIRDFYIKRILKIWPLYFLIGIFGFFIFPTINYYLHINYLTYNGKYFWLKIVFYFLFIPPFIVSKTTGQAWSVRVEEAFYLVWPLLLSRFKNPIKVFVWVIIFVIITHNTTDYFFKMHAGNNALKQLFRIVQNYRVSCMAIGGLGAYWVVKKNQKVLSIIYRKDFQWLLYIITAILLLFKVQVRFILFEFYSVLFTCIVVNLATNPNSIVNLDYKWMNYLGKISYGLYLYNSITRIFCLEFVEHLFGKQVSGWQMEIVLYVFTISSTILVAMLSYEFFEKPFLKLKYKFTA